MRCLAALAYKTHWSINLGALPLFRAADSAALVRAEIIARSFFGERGEKRIR